MNRSVVVFLFLGLGVTLGVTFVVMAPEPDVQQTIEWLDNPRGLGGFKLETESGDFDNQSLMGHWTIVVFGFLHCPDICPTSLAQMATFAATLAERSLGKDVEFVFVSVDPGRDSVTEVDQYARHFDSSILGVTGTKKQLTQFATDLGIQFKVSPDIEDYTVAHSITFSIIDSEGDFRGRFRPGFNAASLVRDFASRLNSKLNSKLNYKPK